jgi:hypothetical protein
MNIDELNFDKKFEYLKQTVESEKQNTVAKDLSARLESAVQGTIKGINLKSTELCRSHFDRLVSLSKNSGDVHQLQAAEGKENEFRIVKRSYMTCVEDKQDLAKGLFDYHNSIKNLTDISDQMCFNQCKNELRQKRQEDFAKKCLTSCFRYRDINMSTAYSVLSKENEVVLNKL